MRVGVSGYLYLSLYIGVYIFVVFAYRAYFSEKTQ